jgi:gliding motility-associated-like protein
LVVNSPGMYYVTVKNSFNCSRTDSIKVKDICTPQVFVPNVFTPDGDGKDDFFQLFGNHYKNLKITVFNRWGEIIFYGNEETFWDGTYLRELMPIGVYPWLVTYEGEYEEVKGPYTLQGSVLILK